MKGFPMFHPSWPSLLVILGLFAVVAVAAGFSYRRWWRVRPPIAGGRSAFASYLVASRFRCR